jgi:hypothetical protein
MRISNLTFSIVGIVELLPSWTGKANSVPVSATPVEGLPEQLATNQVGPVTGAPIMIKITPESPKIRVGSSLQLHANSFGYRPRDGFLWRSLDKAIARVSELGIVTGVGVGSARITAAPKGDTAALGFVVVVVE